MGLASVGVRAEVPRESAPVRLATRELVQQMAEAIERCEQQVLELEKVLADLSLPGVPSEKMTGCTGDAMVTPGLGSSWLNERLEEYRVAINGLSGVVANISARLAL